MVSWWWIPLSILFGVLWTAFMFALVAMGRDENDGDS